VFLEERHGKVSDKSLSPEGHLSGLAIYAHPGIIWFEVLVAVGLILAMEAKVVHRFVAFAGPASNSRGFDLFVSLLYPLMVAGLAMVVFYSLRRLLSKVPEGRIILRVVVFHGLLLLNIVFLGMSVIRF